VIQDVPVAAKFHCPRDVNTSSFRWIISACSESASRAASHRIASIDVSGRDGRKLLCRLLVP